MKRILLIRHGATAGNLERRYIGRMDEPLCSIGIAQAQAFRPRLPGCGAVFASPLLRCVQTCGILFPGIAPVLVPDFRECDFGIFEGKSAAELADSPEYARWLDTGCMGRIPGGEDVADFRRRVCEAFSGVISSLPEDGICAFVLHGGAIMAILERFARPKQDFYAYRIGNCESVSCRCSGEVLTIVGD